MKKLVMTLAALAATAATAAISSIDLGSVQSVAAPAKALALRVDSTKADAGVRVYGIRTVESWTNRAEITSTTLSNLVVTVPTYGVYVRGMFTYTNTTGNAWMNSRGSDVLSWTNYTNDWYTFTHVDGIVTNTATVRGTNTVYIGGRSFDWDVVELPPVIATNIVTTARTNLVPVLKARKTITNTVANVTCSGGTATTNLSAFIFGGDFLAVEGLSVPGEAVKATLIIEK